MLRPGARFTCFSDGFCCSDIHFLGPLDRAEIRLLKRAAPGSFQLHPEYEGSGMITTEAGECTLLREGRCSLHASGGFDAKPKMCRRYPYSLIATPAGGRVATMHRCPCRTMGDRAPLDPAEVEASLRDERGAVRADGRAPSRMPITRRTRVSFATYQDVEATILARLAAGEAPLSVLECDTKLPTLHGGFGWNDVGNKWVAGGTGDKRSSAAALWFGAAILALHRGERLEFLDVDERPWKRPFDRAEARSPAQHPREIFNDWLADSLFGLGWLMAGSLEIARLDLAVRLLVADTVTTALVHAGVRPDRAAAESLLVAEVGSFHGAWQPIVNALASPRRTVG